MATTPEHKPEEHPRGTLAVMAVYGVLFALGWFAIYFFLYVARGPVTP